MSSTKLNHKAQFAEMVEDRPFQKKLQPPSTTFVLLKAKIHYPLSRFGGSSRLP
jgi:hypothetical protein